MKKLLFAGFIIHSVIMSYMPYKAMAIEPERCKWFAAEVKGSHEYKHEFGKYDQISVVVENYRDQPALRDFYIAAVEISFEYPASADSEYVFADSYARCRRTK